jgi:hypothetical protein
MSVTDKFLKKYNSDEIRSFKIDGVPKHSTKPIKSVT